MKKSLIPILVLFCLPFAALAQENADTKSFETSLPPKLTAPDVPGAPLPGPKKLSADTCTRAPEVCEARKEEMRRKRQDCRDNPAACSDPALKSAKNE